MQNSFMNSYLCVRLIGLNQLCVQQLDSIRLLQVLKNDDLVVLLFFLFFLSPVFIQRVAPRRPGCAFSRHNKKGFHTCQQSADLYAEYE